MVRFKSKVMTKIKGDEMFKTYNLEQILSLVSKQYETNPYKIAMELDKNEKFYNVSVYKKVIYNDKIRDAVITLKVNTSDFSAVVYDAKDKNVCELTILNE